MVQPTRWPIHWASSIDSTPWSCAAWSPIWLTMSITRLGASSLNTPTVRISWGRRLTMSATSPGRICRGEGAKTKPTAAAPIPTAKRKPAAVVITDIWTNTPSERSVIPPLIMNGPRPIRLPRLGGHPNGPASPPPALHRNRRRPTGLRRPHPGYLIQPQTPHRTERWIRATWPVHDRLRTCADPADSPRPMSHPRPRPDAVRNHHELRPKPPSRADQPDRETPRALGRSRQPRSAEWHRLPSAAHRTRRPPTP